MTHHSSRSGFTLTEILIVVAIGVVLTASGFLSLNSFRNRKDVEFSMLEVTAAVRGTRERSVTQEEGFGWGIRFTSTSTGDTYEVFQGSSYVNGTTTATHSFRRPVEFGEPSGNRTVDILFNPISGKVSTRKIITVAPKASRSYVGDIIVNTQGLVTQRMEDGVVGYWHFDEGTSTSTYDASSNDNTGTVSGATWQSGSSCRAGGCLSFDGSSNYISISNSSSLQPVLLTMSAWVKTTATSQTGCVIAKQLGTSTNNSYALYANSGNVTFCVGPSGGSCTGSVDPNSLPSNSWVHFAGVYDGSNTYLYRNGVEVDKDSRVITIGYDANPVHVGANSNDGVVTPETCWFDGTIDEVRVYSRALTATEISNHYDDLK